MAESQISSEHRVRHALRSFALMDNSERLEEIILAASNLVSAMYGDRDTTQLLYRTRKALEGIFGGDLPETQTLENAGTPEACGTVLCKMCKHLGDVREYEPAMTVYQDIRCPECGSTSNDHNTAYQEKLFWAMKEISKAEDQKKEEL